ncbi:hypothetical protein [Lachnoclostridium sp. Marseille-P6806]|uniref:hypothetical protein n=1 Tax=Lachnoclostridium sp. Marseille-P6806 TaxID=2364793 RepID=UPI001A922F4A|nr:hypothetical protein [Lachnoclostridium sp. Marseille-P6806]
MMASNYTNKWYKLDNAAIIVPCSAHGSDTRVFRIACELKEPVDPELLQQCLDDTMEEFPYLNSYLRKGLFWYYLDGLRRTARVEEDAHAALRPIYFPGRRNLLYRVTYYHCRINLEMFHVLADGTGAFVFFRRLLTNYLARAHHLSLEDAGVTDTSSLQEKAGDAFSHYYRHVKGSDQLKQMTSVKAFQIRTDRDPNLQNHLIEGVVSAKRFVDAAHEHRTTVGILAVSLYIAAILDGMSVHDRKRPVVISVPVNLRQFFPSETARNFFGVINIPFSADKYDGTLESIIDVVRASFSAQLTPDRISSTMNSYSALVNNYVVKVVPLFLKEPVMTYYLAHAHSGITATISNMERIHMPREVEGYIDHFAAFMTAPSMQITMATYGDKLVFGSAGSYADHQVMLHFYRRLTAMGMEAEIATNDCDAPDSAESAAEKKTAARRARSRRREKRRAAKQQKKAAKEAR